MRFLITASLTFLFVIAPAFSQLSRIGTDVSKAVQEYFGIARRIDNVDFLRVDRKHGVSFIGVRNGVDVDTVAFTPDEIPVLDRYLRDYETMLSNKADVFISDTEMRRILGRVAPRRFFNSKVRPISVRLSDGTMRTGIPLVASDTELLLSDSLIFVPHRHILEKSFSCIPTSLIETMTSGIGDESSHWYRVDGNVLQFRSAIGSTCPERAYMYGSPPEFESCVKTPMDTFGLGAPFSVICPRRMGWSVTGSGGFLQTAKEPVANVVTSINDPDGEPLKFQPITYSFGIDASIPVSASNDIGIRGSINAQPSTIDDASMQNSLGMDQYQIQVIGTWHLLAIDDIGYNKFGMSTTFALGPSFLWYRTRTYNDFANFTSTGTGLAIDASLNIQMMYSISRAVAVGFRGTASYQLGISSSLSDITWPEPDGNQWTATFSISDQSAAYLGAQLVVSYTLP